MLKYLINRSTTTILKSNKPFGLKLNETTSCQKMNYTILSQFSIGTQNTFREAYYELCEMDFDSVEAFNVLIDKLENKETKSLMESFRGDHLRHIKEIQDIMMSKGEKYPNEPNAMKWLTKGKIYLATIAGDRGLLNGMLSNEKDLESAYEIMVKRNDQWPEAMDQLKRGFSDEKRHRLGIEKSIGALKD